MQTCRVMLDERGMFRGADLVELHQEQYELNAKRIYFPVRYRPAFAYAVCDDEEGGPILFVLFEEIETVKKAA